MTAFAVILKTFPILSSAISFFLEDGPAADTGLFHSVCRERKDLKDMWPLRTKKDQIFKCLKGILLTLNIFIFAMHWGIQHSLISKMLSQI